MQNILSVFVILLFGYIGFRVNKRFFRTLPESFYVTAAAGGMCLYFILMPALELGKQYSNRIFQNFVVLGITLSILLFYIMLIAFYRVNQLRQYYKNESILKEDLLQASKEYCREILDNEREVRKIRHDINDHFTSIGFFARQKKYQQLSDYLTKVNENVENQGKVRRWTGNELLDAMLTRYIARESFIDFEVESDYSEIGMSNYEICTLFSNAISNAVEACHRLTNTEKKIEIKIKKVRNHSIIVIRNPLEDKLESKSGKSDNKKTTKEDKQNHGFGIEIMQEIIQEKGGSIDFVEKEGWFTVSIVLPLQEENFPRLTPTG